MAKRYTFRAPLKEYGNIIDDEKTKPKHILCGILEQSTAHGLSKLIKSRGYFKRIIWSFACFCIVTAFVINMILFVFDYVARDVHVNVEIVSAKRQPFPAVTVCNMNPIKASALGNNGALDNLLGSKRRRRSNPDCVNPVEPVSGKCFFMLGSDIVVTWANAKSRCEATGAQLATITTQAMMDHIVTHDIGVSRYWINLKLDSNLNAYWQLPTGNVLDAVANWEPGILMEADKCAAGITRIGHQWRLRACSAELGVMCEQETTSPLLSTSEMETTSPLLSTSEMKTKSPLLSTSEMKTTSPLLSTSEMETTSPLLSTSEMETTSPLLSTSEMETTSPLLSTSEMETTSPLLSTSEMKTTSPLLSTSEMETTSPLLSTSEEVETTSQSLSTLEKQSTSPLFSTSEMESTSQLLSTSETKTISQSLSTSGKQTTSQLFSTSKIDTTSQITSIEETTSQLLSSSGKVTSHISETLSTSQLLSTLENKATSPSLSASATETTSQLLSTSDNKITTSTASLTTRPPISTNEGNIASTLQYELSTGRQTERIFTTKQPSSGPTPIEGSSVLGRVAQREDFMKEEKFYEVLANIDTETKTQLGYKNTEFILDCQFVGAECDISEMSHFYNNLHGNCYTFNSGWNISQEMAYANKEGRKFALQLVINVGQDEYLPNMGDAVGAKIVVHSRGTMPHPSDEGFMADTGKLTSLALEKVSILKLPDPYGDCLQEDPPDLDVFAEHFPVNYSVMGCFKTCYQKHVIKECGCADADIPMTGGSLGWPNTTACDKTNVQQGDCLYIVTKQYVTDKLPCHCPTPCRKDLYLPELSTHLWPSDQSKDSTIGRFGDLGAEMLKNDKYKKNLLKLEVYFKSLNYKKLTEVPSYSAGEFASDLGGTVSLWIGASSISVMEWYECGLDMVILGIMKLIAKRKTVKTSNKL